MLEDNIIALVSMQTECALFGNGANDAAEKRIKPDIVGSINQRTPPMTDRRNRPVNRWGCKPTEDVCVQHDLPLECSHGCYKAKRHKCAWKEQDGYVPAIPLSERMSHD